MKHKYISLYWLILIWATPALALGDSAACSRLTAIPGGVQAPTASPGYIRKGFGEYEAPRRGGKAKHTGVDLILSARPSDSKEDMAFWEVRAIAAGTVAHARWATGYGEVVVIDHGTGCYTLYAHIAGEPFSPVEPGGNLPVKLGDKVIAGQRLGYIRNTKADLDSTGNANALPEPYNLQTHIELIAAPAGRSGDGKLGETVKSGSYELRDPTSLMQMLGYSIR